MTLNQIIPPEIKNDMFYSALKMMASSPGINTILEIGSSSGQGSTQALVEAVRSRSDRDRASLFCMEISKERFEALQSAYAGDAFVKCFNYSSVALQQFPTVAEVMNFYNSTRTVLNNYPLEVILGWLQQDLDYVASSGLNFNGIERIKHEANITTFDMVLIDGSEFTGESEFHSVAGARVIALDDINAHKCFNVYHMLKHHVSYQLVIENMELRHGFAIFQRKF